MTNYFEWLCDPEVKTTASLFHHVISKDSPYYAPPKAREVLAAANAFLCSKTELARKEMLGIQPQIAHRSLAVFTHRCVHLQYPDASEDFKINIAIDLLDQYSVIPTSRLKQMAPIVASDLFNFLKYLGQSGHTSLAECLLIRSQYDLGKRTLIAIISSKLDLKEYSSEFMYESIYQAISKTDSVKNWVTRNVLPRKRIDVYRTTGWPEVLEAMRDREKGMLLSDSLGL